MSKKMHLFLVLILIVSVFIFSSCAIIRTSPIYRTNTAQQLSLLSEKVAHHFSVVTPDTASAGQPFMVEIIAKDEFDTVITDYDERGGDVALITTGSGKISPTLVKASEFKKGKAKVLVRYDKAEDFIIVARERPRPLSQKQKTRRKRKEYAISQEDVLQIRVWEWPDLKTDAIVRPDGKISIPLVGDIQAEGKTLTELDNEITERLKAFIRTPQVSVMLKKFGGQKIVVLGEVRQPGVYKVTGENTLLDMIGIARGFTEDAVLNSIILIRGDFTNPQVQRLNLTSAIVKGNLAENVYVQPEDVIYVPKKFIANMNYFLRQFLPALTAADFYGRFAATQAQ